MLDPVRSNVVLPDRPGALSKENLRWLIQQPWKAQASWRRFGRSTLSYANEHRPWQLYKDIFHQVLFKCKALSLGHKFRFKNKLYSLDATFLELCVSLFDWAEYRQTKGAVKLHMLLDHDGYLPVFAHVRTGKVHEINVARQLVFPKGPIVAMDKGYVVL